MEVGGARTAADSTELYGVRLLETRGPVQSLSVLLVVAAGIRSYGGPTSSCYVKPTSMSVQVAWSLCLFVVFLKLEVSDGMGRKECYSILGLDDNATEADVRLRFRRLAVRYHPDKNDHPDASQKFQQILEAFQAISEDIKRAQEEEKRRKGADDKLHWRFSAAEPFADLSRKPPNRQDSIREMLSRMSVTGDDRDDNEVFSDMFVTQDDMSELLRSGSAFRHHQRSAHTGMVCRTFTTEKDGRISRHTRCS